MRYIDAHIHLEQYALENQKALLDETRLNGIEKVIAVSMHLESCKQVQSLHRQYLDIVFPAYGFHPEQLLPSEKDRLDLMNWIRERHHQGERFAIGEVGLPYYNELEDVSAGRTFHLEPYIDLLEEFIILAKEINAPLALHAVYHHAAIVCDLLDKHGYHRAHFHWFKGDPSTIQRMIKNDYYISVTPDVCYEPEIKEIVRDYPITNLMVETDGPWLFEGQFLGQETRSKMVIAVVDEIAKIKGIAVDETARMIFENTKAFYSV